MFRSIRWRMATVFAIFVLICITAVGIYITHLVKEIYLENLKTQLISQAQLVSNSSSSYFVNADIAGINTLTKRLGNLIDERITIVNKYGVVLGDSEENPFTIENQADSPEFIEAFSKGIGNDIRYDTSWDYNTLYVAVPVVVNSKTEGAVRVSLSLVKMDKSVESTRMIMTLVTLIAAAVTILLALQISKIITKPLTILTQASKKIADGELSQQIRITSKDEISELAKAMDQMVTRFKDMIANVTSQRDNMATILSQMSDGVFTVDRNKKVIMVNKAAERMLGVLSEKAIGHTFIEVVLDYELDGILRRCLDSGEQQAGMVSTSFNKQLLGVIATPLPSNAGCLILLQDHTEFQRVESMRRDFVSNVSHELRTPISSLKAISETLQDGAINDPSVAKGFLDSINIEVDRLAQMVQELGELSRIESGAMPLQKKQFDIVETIEQAVERLQTQADRASLILKINVPPDLPQVFADKNLIEQVLINIIHNAIKFTSPNGSISISAKPENNNILISIADTGIGIPADDLPRVFERFYKIDKSRSSSGTGLGLAIVKHIIEAHGGRIWVESGERKGSTFHLTIPFATRA